MEANMYKSYIDNVSQNKLSFSKKNQASTLQRRKKSPDVSALDNANRPAAGMREVNTHYSPVRTIQFKAGSGKVIQFERHISALNGISNTQIDVIPSIRPTMIFESMGKTNAVMEHVYRETEKYKGNTVCVFGLNQEAGTGPALQKAADKFETPHNVVNFSFEWTKPANMDPAKGYKMPFVEARQAIMAQANRLILNPRAPGGTEQTKVIYPQRNPEADMSLNPLYRWIDGDAENDSSNDINITFLRNLAKSDADAEIVTGSYHWRHDSGDTVRNAPNYHAFIHLVNQKEAFLRKAYFDAMDTADNNYLSGNFYMPETTFLVNQAAHNPISRPSNIALNTAAASGTNKIDPDGDQAQESARLYRASGIPANKIHYREDLHATKPLKDEFSDTGYAKSLILFFTQNTTYNKTKLKEALSGFRQSAFGNSWMPKGSADDYKQKKELCITEIDGFLRNNNKFRDIREEIQAARRR